MQANQQAISITSNNVTNANTTGYARQVVQFTALDGGPGLAGVELADVTRVSDDFYLKSARLAIGREESANTVFSVLDRVQSAFGDPTSGTSMFDSMSNVFSTFALLGGDPSAPASRAQLTADFQSLIDDMDRVEQELATVRRDVDTQIHQSVERVNELLAEIPTLNAEVIAGDAAGRVSGANDTLAVVLDELSSLMDINVSKRDTGAIDVYTPDGALLASTFSATLSYSSTGVGAAGESFDPITIEYPDAQPTQLDRRLTGGKLDGLLQLRDQELPEIGLQLSEFAAGFAQAINKEANANVAFPPPTSLDGVDVGLLGTDSLGFSGNTTLSILQDDGTLDGYYNIDFDAGTITDDAGAVTAFTPAGAGTIDAFVTALNGAMGGVATATFADGALSIDGGANGVAFSQPDTDPSSRGGRGFSEYFRLNDIITSSTALDFNTGLQASDNHGFTNGQTIELRLADEDNRTLIAPTVTISGTTMQDVLDDLNDTTNGLGAYGSFGLDANGALSFTPDSGHETSKLYVVDDQTQRGTTSFTFSDLVGLGDGPRIGRTTSLSVNEAMVGDTGLIPMGRLDTTDASFVVGQVVTGYADGAGAQALQAAETATRTFADAGGIGEISTTLSDYGARVLADAGSRAYTAQREMDSAERYAEETATRRASNEGVNIDEELVKLAQYQQGYQASSRLIQAAQDMLDILLSIV